MIRGEQRPLVVEEAIEFLGGEPFFDEVLLHTRDGASEEVIFVGWVQDDSYPGAAPEIREGYERLGKAWWANAVVRYPSDRMRLFVVHYSNLQLLDEE